MITNSMTSSGKVTHGLNKDPEDKKAYVLVDYAVSLPTMAVRFLTCLQQFAGTCSASCLDVLQVPPSKQDEFIAAFQKTAGPTKDEEGKDLAASTQLTATTPAELHTTALLCDLLQAASCTHSPGLSMKT